MAVLIPSPAELAAMPAWKRRKARARIARIAAATLDALPPEAAHARNDPHFGETVRAQARRLREAMVDEAEHVTRERRAALVEAVYG